MKNSENAIHRAAADGFPRAAEDYVRGRPDYPPEIVDWLRDQIGLHSGATVVDLGAGTGKFTPRLVETGARVIAVEPIAEMLSKLAAAWPQVEALAATAESLPLPDASVDAVVCAQAFHWFATREALAEIDRVLKPAGRLGLVWNMKDERVGWVAHLDQIMKQVEGDTPRYQSGAWRELLPFPGFGPLFEHHFPHGHIGTPEDVIIHRVRSTSFIAALAPEERATIEDQVRALIATAPELIGKDLVTFPYVTVAFSTVKVD
ncbi:methyltransferase domain-containing protein [Singulisphaera sp. Ch08]|uniref:Methyltransferase domain-containing protein n=1 Tax=Singulisphaera sp. Ch08 TaxID=3120278 RepID=A0AAU7CLE7_9BACT